MAKKKNPDLKTYIKDKIKMLEHEFCMKLSPAERAHFHTLKSNLEVDQYAHDLFMKEDWNGESDYHEYEKRHFL